MAEIKARSFRQVRLLVNRTEESREAAKLLAGSAALLFKCGIEVIHVSAGENAGPELHDGSDIKYGLGEIWGWLEQLKKEQNGR